MMSAWGKKKGTDEKGAWFGWARRGTGTNGSKGWWTRAMSTDPQVKMATTDFHFSEVEDTESTNRKWELTRLWYWQYRLLRWVRGSTIQTAMLFLLGADQVILRAARRLASVLQYLSAGAAACCSLSVGHKLNSHRPHRISMPRRVARHCRYFFRRKGSPRATVSLAGNTSSACVIRVLSSTLTAPMPSPMLYALRTRIMNCSTLRPITTARLSPLLGPGVPTLTCVSPLPCQTPQTSKVSSSTARMGIRVLTSPTGRFRAIQLGVIHSPGCDTAAFS